MERRELEEALDARDGQAGKAECGRMDMTIDDDVNGERRSFLGWLRPPALRWASPVGGTSFHRKEEALLGVAHQHVVRRAAAGGSFVIQEDRRNRSLMMVLVVLGRPLRLRVMQRGRTVGRWSMTLRKFLDARVSSFWSRRIDGGRTGAQQFQVLNDSRLFAHLFLDEAGSRNQT